MILVISVSQLSFGTQGDHISRVHQAIQALGRDVPVAGKNRAWELGYLVRSCTVHCENFARHACGEFVKSDVLKKQSGSALNILCEAISHSCDDKKEGAETLQINYLT